MLSRARRTSAWNVRVRASERIDGPRPVSTGRHFHLRADRHLAFGRPGEWSLRVSPEAICHGGPAGVGQAVPDGQHLNSSTLRGREVGAVGLWRVSSAVCTAPVLSAGARRKNFDGGCLTPTMEDAQLIIRPTTMVRSGSRCPENPP